MKRTVLGILGTLILGALGSGLWEAIKPGFSFLGSTALGVVSLGIDSLVNDIYHRAGVGNPTATWTKAGMLLVIGFATYGIAGYWLVRTHIERAEHGAIRLTGLGAGLALVIFAAVLLFGGLRHAYVANTRGYFDYLQRLSAPYMSSEQRVLLDSRLARVKTRPEFEQLITEMRQVLDANKIEFEEL